MNFNTYIIQEDRYVLLRLPSGNIRVEKLIRGSTLALGKFGTFHVDGILGKPFGFTYEIQPDQSVQIVSEDKGSQNVLVSNETNRELLDNPENQALTALEIEAFKKQGVAGDKIIQRVVANHGMFDKKTALSQEKYLIRKQKKFLQRFTPDYISTNELIELYHDKDAQKVMKITIENLAYMMSIANIQPGGIYLVIDDIKGVLVSALMERMGGQGLIVILHSNETSNLDALKYMNFPDEVVDAMINEINLLEFFHPEEIAAFEGLSAEQIEAMKPHQRGVYYRRKAKHEKKLAILDLMKYSKFQGLLSATELYLPTLVPRLLPYLEGSATLALYNEFKEVLTSTNQVLLKDLRVVGPTIIESRVRAYQSIPGRLHPNMTTPSAGGYVLSGIRVIPSEGAQALGKGNRKKSKDNETEESLDA